jgi:predicted secreted protein
VVVFLKNDCDRDWLSAFPTLMSSLPPQLVICDPVAETEVQIIVGARFIVRLTENPTTGHRWHYENTEKSVLAYLGNDYLSHGALPGSDGYRSFYFLGSLVGTAPIQFMLRHAWETASPQRALQLLVTVSKV